MTNLSQQVRDVVEALKPFAECCVQIAKTEDDEEWAKFRLLIKDYRRARNALSAIDLDRIVAALMDNHGLRIQIETHTKLGRARERQFSHCREERDQLRQSIRWAADIIADSWGDEQMERGDCQAYNILRAVLGETTEPVSKADELARPSDRSDYDISDDGVMTPTDEWQRNNEATCLRLLSCHSVDVPMEVVAGWTDEQVRQADIWAWTSYLSASDNDDIQVPPRPEFIPVATGPMTRNPITGEPWPERKGGDDAG